MSLGIWEYHCLKKPHLPFHFHGHAACNSRVLLSIAWYSLPSSSHSCKLPAPASKFLREYRLLTTTPSWWLLLQKLWNWSPQIHQKLKAPRLGRYRFHLRGSSEKSQQIFSLRIWARVPAIPAGSTDWPLLPVRPTILFERTQKPSNTRLQKTRWMDFHMGLSIIIINWAIPSHHPTFSCLS